MRTRLALALSLLGSAQIAKLALPWLTAQAINAIQLQGSAGARDAAWWIVAIVALHTGAWLLHGPGRVLERGVALEVRRSAADAMYARLAGAPLAWHEQRHSGDLQHRVAQASGALSSFTQSQFVYLQTTISLVGPLLALWWLSTWMGVIATLAFVAVALAVLRFDRALMRLAAHESDAERRYVARLIDFLGNISAVASLRLQRATRTLLDTRLAAVAVPLKRSIVLAEGKWCSVDLLTIALSWALVVVYALTAGGDAGVAAAGGPASAAANGSVLLVGNLLMAQQYAQQAGGVLVSMAASLQGLAHMRADFAAGAPVREAPSAWQGAGVAPAAWRRIDITGLGFDHAAPPGSTPSRGIDDVTLHVERGERIAVVGPSGCGKSTLMRVLAGLYDATRGCVAIDGVAGHDCRHLGDWATLIPQHAEVFEASVRDNLTLGGEVSDAALQRALHASAFDDVVAGLPQGLDTALAERGANLSGGQRQRLALARGLLAADGSSLLLLDEPTSALDALTEQQVIDRLTAAYPDACIVASVHRLSLLSHFDRVVFMHEGRVTDGGTIAELETRQPLFAAMRRGMLREAPAQPAAA
jgi:ATP-binding cassette, subfamily B, bacterial